MLEVAGGLAIQRGHGLHAQLLQQFGQDNAAHRVHGVERHAEVCLPNCLNVHQLQVLHQVDMLLVVGIVLVAQMVHIGELKVLSLGYAQHFLAFPLIQELALFVQQFQGIPHTGVVAGCEDDAAAGPFHADGNFRRGGRGKAYVHHVETHTHQGAAHDVLHHLTRDARVASDYDFVGFHPSSPANKCCVS